MFVAFTERILAKHPYRTAGKGSLNLFTAVLALAVTNPGIAGWDLAVAGWPTAVATVFLFSP
jgi:hypothetical protein